MMIQTMTRYENPYTEICDVVVTNESLNERMDRIIHAQELLQNHSKNLPCKQKKVHTQKYQVY